MDIEGIDALIEALKVYKGGVISISHDERFITNTSNQVSQSNVRDYTGITVLIRLALGVRRWMRQQVHGRCGKVQVSYCRYDQSEDKAYVESHVTDAQTCGGPCHHRSGQRCRLHLSIRGQFCIPHLHQLLMRLPIRASPTWTLARRDLHTTPSLHSSSQILHPLVQLLLRNPELSPEEAEQEVRWIKDDVRGTLQVRAAELLGPSVIGAAPGLGPEGAEGILRKGGQAMESGSVTALRGVEEGIVLGLVERRAKGEPLQYVLRECLRVPASFVSPADQERRGYVTKLGAARQSRLVPASK